MLHLLCFFCSRRRHTRCALVTGVQTCALPISPCIGPTLAAIILMSWNLGDPARAGLLGLAYSLGLGIPFLILAAGWGWASRSVAFLRRHIRALNIIGGAMLIALGLLMVTGLWTALMSQLQQVVINVPLPDRKSTRLNSSH